MEKENALEKAFAQIKEAVETGASDLKETKKAVKKAVEKKETKVSEKKTASAEPAKKAAPVKKAPAKTTSVKTAEKKEKAVKTAVTFEFNGKKILAKDVLDRAMKAYQDAHKDAAIESFELYIVASENAAYYVVNGVGSDSYKIEL